MDLYGIGIGVAWALLGFGAGFALRAPLAREPASARRGWSLAFVAGLVTLAVTTLHYRMAHGPASPEPLDGEAFARGHSMVLLLLAGVVLAMVLARWAERRASVADPDEPA